MYNHNFSFTNKNRQIVLQYEEQVKGDSLISRNNNGYFENPNM